KNILTQLQQIQEVADKFQVQLNRIFQAVEVNEEYLAERLQAATLFFTEKIEFLLETFRQSPANTDSRDNAREYNDQLRANFAYIAQKKHVFKGLKNPFTVENYFSIKNSFLLPDFEVNAYTKTGKSKSIVSKNPTLYYELLTLRNEICEPRNLPIYIVAGSDTLLEMADFLPLTNADLLRIKGFGPAKVEKYGPLFLELIQKYCKVNNLNSAMHEKLETKSSKKEKAPVEVKEKKQKGDSHRATYELFKAGKTIHEIASERSLALSTVCSHLGRFIALGNLNINQFITKEKRENAMKLMETIEDGSIYQTLGSVMDAVEINFFLAWFRAQKSNQN
ncbi:MAG: helix-turn-helix domain-containing protein, partial [Paludibacter sp.]